MSAGRPKHRSNSVWGAEHQHPPLGAGPGGPRRTFDTGPRPPSFQQPFAVGGGWSPADRIRCPGGIFSRICHFKTDAVLHTGQPALCRASSTAAGSISRPRCHNGRGILSMACHRPPASFESMFFHLSGKLAGPGSGARFLKWSRAASILCAAAAEGVAEGILSPVTGEGHQRCRQRFTQGAPMFLARYLPLVKALARGVPDTRSLHPLIMENWIRYRLPDPAGSPRRTSPQPLSGRLFHDGLAGGDRMKLRVQGIALTGTRCPWDIILPGQA